MVQLPPGFADPMPADFNRLASAAARLGRVAIPVLMLAARDGRTLRAQLCAIKALGMMPHPTAVEARRRISSLQLDGDRGKIVRSAFSHGMPFDEPWDVDNVIATLLRNRDSLALSIAFPADGAALRAAAAVPVKRSTDEKSAELAHGRLKAVRASVGFAGTEEAEHRRREAKARQRVLAEARRQQEARRRTEQGAAAAALRRSRVASSGPSSRSGRGLCGVCGVLMCEGEHD